MDFSIIFKSIKGPKFEHAALIVNTYLVEPLGGLNELVFPMLELLLVLPILHRRIADLFFFFFDLNPIDLQGPSQTHLFSVPSPTVSICGLFFPAGTPIAFIFVPSSRVWSYILLCIVNFARIPHPFRISLSDKGVGTPGQFSNLYYCCFPSNFLQVRQLSWEEFFLFLASTPRGQMEAYFKHSPPLPSTCLFSTLRQNPY